jgi:hypothetical protein
MQPPGQPRIHAGHVQLGVHGNLGVYYNVATSEEDLDHAKQTHYHYRVSAWFLLAIALLMRGFCFFVMLLIPGALLMAEILLLTCWVELLTWFFTWTRHRILLFGAKWLMVCSVVAKVLYLATWLLNGRRYGRVMMGGGHWGWWAVYWVLIAYIVVDLWIIFCLVNMLKSKNILCWQVNNMRKIKGRRTTQKEHQ